MQPVMFLCPKCGAALSLAEERQICPKCAHEWPVIDGVQRLSSSPSYWDILPPQEMQALLTEVRIRGWKEALLSSPNPKIKELYLFTDAPARADGAFYLSLNSHSTILDLGSGWGSYTFALSPRVGQVMAADSNLASLTFIALRAQQEKRTNIHAVQIEPLDYGKIPFADKSFNAVIMNGVLEWVGSYLKCGDPLKMQMRCLGEVKRILKPQGALWIGIENRFGLRYFYGAPDDHLKYYSSKMICYTTLVPRMAANLITQKLLGQPYRTYTHSLWGLKRLLRRAGFGRQQFFFPEQDYRAASTRIIPLESQEIKNHIRKRLAKSRWGGIVSRLKLEPYLCDSYFIAAGE